MNTDFYKPHHINHFLLVVTAPISRYLEEPHLYLNIQPGLSPFFCSWANPYNKNRDIEKDHILFEKTEAFLNVLINLKGCGCEHCVGSDETYDLEVKEALQEYVPLLAAAWNAQDFETQLNQAVPEFGQDYSFWVAKLNNGECSIEIFEQELMVWKDAVPDELLINALLSVRFDFINRILFKN